GEQLLLNSAQNTVNLRAASQPGFGQLEEAGQRWISFTLQTHFGSFPVVLIVAAREDIGGELLGQVVLQTLIPEMIALPFFSVLLWSAVGSWLPPSAGLARQLIAVDAHDLQARRLAAPRLDVLRVKRALSALLPGSVRRMARAHRFSAHAAHALRAPL